MHLFVLLTFLLSSCGDATAPENLMDEDRYVKVFSELVVINQLTDEQLGPVSREYLREQVYEKYNITDEQFSRSHRYYQQQPDKQYQRIDKIENLLTSERDIFQERLNQMKTEIRDSVALADSLSKLEQVGDTIALPDTLEIPDDILPE